MLESVCLSFTLSSWKGPSISQEDCSNVMMMMRWLKRIGIISDWNSWVSCTCSKFPWEHGCALVRWTRLMPRSTLQWKCTMNSEQWTVQSITRSLVSWRRWMLHTTSSTTPQLEEQTLRADKSLMNTVTQSTMHTPDEKMHWISRSAPGICALCVVQCMYLLLPLVADRTLLLWLLHWFWTQRHTIVWKLWS